MPDFQTYPYFSGVRRSKQRVREELGTQMRLE